MATNNTPNIDDQFLERAAEIKSIFGDIVSATASMNRALRAAGEPTSNIGATYRGILSSAGKVAQLQEEAKKSSEATKKILEEKAKLQNRERELTAEISRLMGVAASQTGDAKLNTLAQAQNLANARDEAKALSGLYQDMVNESAKLDKSTQFFAKGGEFFKRLGKTIPLLSGLATPFALAEEAARKAIASGKEHNEAMQAGNKALREGLKHMFGPMAMLTASITVLVKMFNFLKDAAFEIDSQTVALQKNIAGSRAEATALRDNFVDIAKSNTSNNELLATGLVTVKNQVAAYGELGDILGATTGFTKEQVEDQIFLTKQIGLSTEAAGGLQRLALASGTTAEDVLDSTIKQTAALRGQRGIQLDNKKVLDEVSKVQGQLFLFYKGSPALISQAVVKSKELGVSLEETRNIAKGLLDFESSIANELEAELLTGKNLNLEYARTLALQGDTVGATAEIARQVGSAAEFAAMNVVQQEALAAATNMSVDALANSLVQRENLAKLGAETREQLEKEVQALKDKGEVEKANRLLATAGNEENAKAALAELTAQQEFNAEIEKLKSLFVEIAPDIRGVMDGIKNGLKVLQENMPVVIGLMSALATAAIAVAISVTASAFGSNLIALAAIGGVGLLGGIAAAYMKGGPSGGSGQPISTTETAMAEGGIVTRPTRALVGEAGPEAVIPLNDLMSKFDKMNNTLETIASREGTVYIDGNRAGRALAMQTYRS